MNEKGLDLSAAPKGCWAWLGQMDSRGLVCWIKARQGFPASVWDSGSWATLIATVSRCACARRLWRKWNRYSLARMRAHQISLASLPLLITCFLAGSLMTNSPYKERRHYSCPILIIIHEHHLSTTPVGIRTSCICEFYLTSSTLTTLSIRMRVGHSSNRDYYSCQWVDYEEMSQAGCCILCARAGVSNARLKGDVRPVFATRALICST